MRSCGDCHLCCYVFPLPVLGKLGDTWCSHVSAAGCAVHGAGQPEVCRRYACYWLDEEELPDAFRPDRIGVIATEGGTIAPHGVEMPVLLLNEAQPGACRQGNGRVMVEAVTAGGGVALILCGPEMRIEYDHDRYPAITPADIEAAFREERAKDAEELRRLGAVEEWRIQSEE
jgi:uncharacterized protein